MIKKLQALKAKKGFTLVELVVVIAIIGVLAAILIPVMVGVVQDANITSANTLAKTIYTNVEGFRTKADGNQNPLKNVASTVVTVKAQVVNGDWTVTAPGAVTEGKDDKPIFGGGKQYFWGSTDPNPDSVALTKENCLEMFLEDVVRDFKNGVCDFYFQDSACVGVAVEQGAGLKNTGGSDDVSSLKNATDSFKTAMSKGSAGDMKWGGGKAGLLADGTIIGTNPQVKYNATSSVS